MKKNVFISLLTAIVLLCSCTTNNILRETNANLEELNRSVDQKFDSLSKSFNNFDSNFEKLTNKVAGDGELLDQMTSLITQLESVDITNLFKAVDSFVAMSEEIESLGGLKGAMVHLNLGMTLGIDLLEKFEKLTSDENKVDPKNIEPYLNAMQETLSLTKDNLNPTVQKIREQIQKLIDLKAKKYNIELDKQISTMNALNTSLNRAENDLNKGLSFINSFEDTDIEELSPQELEALNDQAKTLAESYRAQSELISSAQDTLNSILDNDQTI